MLPANVSTCPVCAVTDALTPPIQPSWTGASSSCAALGVAPAIASASASPARANIDFSFESIITPPMTASPRPESEDQPKAEIASDRQAELASWKNEGHC